MNNIHYNKMAAIHTALHHLGFTHEASQAITINQGMDAFEELCEFMDMEVENLCKMVWRPGGMVPNNANPPVMVPNQGHQVSLQAEKISGRKDGTQTEMQRS